MAGAIDVLNPDKPKRVLMLASSPAVSEQTCWPIGFWWAELTHPYWEFVEHGYQVEIASTESAPLEGDKWSDPRDRSTYSARPTGSGTAASSAVCARPCSSRSSSCSRRSPLGSSRSGAWHESERSRLHKPQQTEEKR
jgi:hypothetical protein